MHTYKEKAFLPQRFSCTAHDYELLSETQTFL